jgi:drug/metabolite transporter (DMT)-like permease
MDRKHPRLDLILAALLFSTGGVFIKALAGMTAWQRAGLRSLVAVVFLLLVWPQARRGYSRKAVIFSLFYAGTLACFVAANTYTTSANAIFLQSTAPLYVLLLSPLVLGEKVQRGDLLFMGALAVGLALCFGGELWWGGSHVQATAPRPVLGNVFGLVSGILWACTIVGLRWFGQRSGGATDAPDSGGAGASVVLGNLACFAVCLLIGAFTGEGIFHGVTTFAPKTYAVLAFLGVFQVGLAYICITRGMARVPAMEASLLLLVEPTFNPVWSFLVLHERPGAWSLAGGAVILGATALHAPAATRRVLT